MDTREIVARAIAGIYWKAPRDVDTRWDKWLPEADAALKTLPGTPEVADEAWRIAQLAATLTPFGEDGEVMWPGSPDAIPAQVRRARAILAESRRQAAALAQTQGGEHGTDR